MRFELIDQVLERHDDKLVTVKNVTSAEEYLADHFPGFSVLPGVMMLEALVQTARLLLAESASDAPYWPSDWDGEGTAPSQEQPDGCAGREPLVLTEVRNVRYGQMVRPGQSLRLEVTLRGQDGDGWEIAGVGTVDGQVAVQGRFRVAPLSASP